MKKLFVVCALILAACGGGADDDVDASGGESTSPTTAAQTGASDAPAGGTGGDAIPGSITLTIGSENYEFDGANCARYNAEPGEDGSEWNVSYKLDGEQVYADVTADYPSLTFAGWSAEGPAVVFEYQGDTITAEGTFQHDDGRTETGTLSATCASWYSG